MYYKLTDQDMQTHGGFQWELGKWYRIEDTLRDRKADLCTPAWFHCYDDPILAIILNRIHAKIPNPRMFRANVRGLRQTDHGLKYGFTMLRLGEELEVPVITTTQGIAFAILCAREVCNDESWLKWGERWLSDEDRSRNAAYAAAYAAADAAAYAADAAVYAAYAADGAADAAAYAADEAAYAADAAVYAADAVNAVARVTLDLKGIARKAMSY